MRVGLTLRNMGPQSSREIVAACARHAEAAGADSIWITDHLAIPPEDSEGSGGRYLDPLTTLAWLGGITGRIGLGVGVLILPYRPPLPTAKAVATVQELCAGRLRLGVGVGWMKPEFKALGVPRGERGRRSDELLEFLLRCFGDDEVEANGQRFLFKPRPEKPPIYVGGAAPHAFVRAARFGDGWMPMGGEPESLAPAISDLRDRFAEAGRGAPEVVCLNGLPLSEGRQAMTDRLGAFEAVGVTTFVQALRYQDEQGYRKAVDQLAPVLA